MDPTSAALVPLASRGRRIFEIRRLFSFLLIVGVVELCFEIPSKSKRLALERNIVSQIWVL